MKKLLALLLLPVSAIAGTASMSWVAPTQNTDGSAISQALTYKVYGGVQGAAKSVLATVSALTYTHSNAPNGVTYCYAVSAVAGGQESAQTAESCKVMPPVVPNPPTGFSVTGSVAYEIGKRGDLRIVGTIQRGSQCFPGVYRSGRFMAVNKSDVSLNRKYRGNQIVAKCARNAA